MQTSVALSHHVDGCTSTFICTLILTKDRKVTEEQTTRVRGRDKRCMETLVRSNKGIRFERDVLHQGMFKRYSFRQGIFVPPRDIRFERDIRSAKGYSFRQPRDVHSKRYSFRQGMFIPPRDVQEIFVPQRDVPTRNVRFEMGEWKCKRSF
jgi:hypothetical protein